MAPAGAGLPALGLTVCEDAWTEPMGYEVDPTGELAGQGAALCVNVSASPFHVGKAAERRAMVSALAARHAVPILFCNQVGGNDELVFDGASFAVDAHGRVLASLPHFETALEVLELEAGGAQEPDPERAAQLEADPLVPRSVQPPG